MASPSLKIGDSVTVPGDMYGTLKFVGPVDGKRGVFAGVQLASEFSARGKNSGAVDGKYYFRTSVPGAGIFLPIDKAEKRMSGGNKTSTSGGLSNFNQGGRMPPVATAKPSFSQSVGPGSLAVRTSSPTTLKPPPRRESLPRPASPLRKVNNASTATTPAAGRLATPKTRPSLGFNRSTIGAPGTIGNAAKSPAVRQPSRFGQSLRQSTRGSVTPNRMRQPPSSSASVTTATTDDYLGPESSFDDSPQQEGPDSGADHTPTPAAGRSFKPKVDTKKYEDEARELREQLEEKDRQLNDQISSIAEMERSLAELHTLISSVDSMEMGRGRQISEHDEELPTDVQNLRAALREKNERIKAMTAEFDNNRADFRSTIDTLEMASTETERVYERRIEELTEDLKHMQERNEDVEGVAQQFRQLEELVQELEEGLEDARRGEAEARGEVEFLRGEVERSRSELRRERERNRTGDKLNGVDSDGGGAPTEDVEDLQVKLDQKDDEIRGLKAIVQSLNNAAAARSPDRNSRGHRMNGGPFTHGHSKTKSTNTVVSIGASEDTALHLQDQIRDLEALLQQKSSREEELKEEVTKLRQSVQFGPAGSKFVVPGLESKHQRTDSNLAKHQSAQSSSTVTAGRSSGSNFLYGSGTKAGRGSEFVDAEQFPQDEATDNSKSRNSKDASSSNLSRDYDVPGTRSVSGETEASSNVMWCEICEESGHDILTCSQMIGSPTTNDDNMQTPKAPQGSFNSSFSSNFSKDTIRDGFRRSHEAQGPPPDIGVPPPPAATARNSAPALSPNVNRSGLQNVTRPAPLSTSRQPSTQAGPKSPLPTPTQEPAITATENKSSGNKLIEGIGDQAGMLAGKESGVIDPDKWCALCERDGHESVDCPIEDDI